MSVLNLLNDGLKNWLNISVNDLTVQGDLAVDGTITDSNAAAGDMIYYDGDGVQQLLNIGAEDRVLAVSSGLPAWVSSNHARETFNITVSGSCAAGGDLVIPVTVVKNDTVVTMTFAAAQVAGSGSGASSLESAPGALGAYAPAVSFYAQVYALDLNFIVGSVQLTSDGILRLYGSDLFGNFTSNDPLGILDNTITYLV